MFNFREPNYPPKISSRKHFSPTKISLATEAKNIRITYPFAQVLSVYLNVCIDPTTSNLLSDCVFNLLATRHD